MKKLIYLFTILCLLVSCYDSVEYQQQQSPIVYYRNVPPGMIGHFQYRIVKPKKHVIILHNHARAYQHRHRH